MGNNSVKPHKMSVFLSFTCADMLFSNRGHVTYLVSMLYMEAAMNPDDVISLLLESATLLAVGMSVVFVFLTMLIGSVSAIAAFCRRFPGPVESVSGQSAHARPTMSSNTESNGDVIAAITAAIHQHRNRK